MSRVVSALALLAACASPDEAATPRCDVSVRQRYDPFVAEEIELFPDDLLVVEDPGSPTGVRLTADPTKAPWLRSLPAQLATLPQALGGLTGFARNGAVVVRFDADPGLITPGPDLRLLDLSTQPATDVPYTLRQSVDQLIVQPLRPLRAGARHGLVLATSHVTPDGGCVGPGGAMAELVSGEVADPRLRRLAPRYAELIEAAGLSPDEVSAAAVWTAADGRGPLRAVAADVASGRVRWEVRPVCGPEGDHRLCRGVMAAWDYRQADGLVDAPPAAPWSLPVRLYLPAAPGPAPLVLFGHGLNSSPSEAGSVADRVSASLGLAVASVAAMHHGDHPTAVDGTDPLAFLGVTLEGLQVDAIAMRASFDQTTADRLQLLQLLRAEPDVDGDGVDDIDPERISYLGISLGGLLGPALLANDDDVDAAALVVGGGYLIRFVTDMELTKLAMPLLASIMGGQDALDRWLIVAQTAVDGSDPAAWATDVLGDRAAAPHLLLEVATQDEVVPPATGQALARALGLPHVAPVAEAVSLVSPVLEAPVESVDGARVVGFLQLDRVSGDDGVEVAVHHNTPMSPEGELVWRSFLEGFADGAGPRILDPYAALGTPALTP